ncbi:succinate--CoA ligase subunit alpha [Streptomyces profundus]|uniref:succinate--CoA ligase subunit alpha n=1 Tax=Streptomyces profundus TaxID=2867410 RepID=UPI001D15FD50|nr:CoA-binding protein [Streptomyces sp. MA3_2.13]UED84692.1 CoA-binding protein [Streptomyces sp. MA3_2.13]
MSRPERGSHRPGDVLRACRGPVVVQGITGRVARRHTRRMRAYGTEVVAGVTPGRDGESVDGVPVFGTVRRAVEATGATVSVAFLPPIAAAEGLMEAAEAGIRLAVSTTEGATPHGMLAALEHAERAGMLVVGPNSPGLLLPERLSLGFLPGDVARAGPVALVSRSGTLSYEVARALADVGLGESAWIGVGGDRFKGTTLVDLLPALEADPGTRALAFVGEIGGADEEEAAHALADSPLACAALIAGRTAPVGTVMGHAGALVGAEGGGYAAKADALLAAGVQVALSPGEMAIHLARRLRSCSR